MSGKGGQGQSVPGSGGGNATGMTYGSPADRTVDGGASAEGSTSPVRNPRLAYQHGHSFIRKTFRTPTNCHYCTELLWGLMGQGYICEGMLKTKITSIKSIPKLHNCYSRVRRYSSMPCTYFFSSMQLHCPRKMLENRPIRLHV